MIIPTRATLRQKLLAVVLLTTLIALLIAIVVISGNNLRAYYRDLVTDMTIQSELLGHMTAPALSFDDKRLAQHNLGLLRIRPQIAAAALYDAKGQLFAAYATPGDTDAPPAKAAADAVQLVGPHLTVVKTIQSDGERIGTVYLRVYHQLGAKALELMGIGLVVMAAAMAIAYGLSSRLQRVVTEPILRMAAIAREVVDKRDYTRRAELVSDDEVGWLARSFNDMLSEIERRTRDLEGSYLEVAREAEERSRAQQEVSRLNSALELRVQERTAQLEATNSELLVANAAAEKANQAKSEFLSSMSHELRTPLNAVLGFAQLIASESVALTPEKRKEFTGHILKAGRHLLELINEILDLSKIESGALSLSIEPVLLADVVRECQEMIEPSAQKRGIRVSYVFDQGLHVEADRTRLKQVLLNVLSNAVKYNRERGEVRLVAEAIEGERLRIKVRDSGQGLKPEQLVQLFQPFNRLGQEVGLEEGTGIGLVVTKRLVELMGGQIHATSTVGQGSEFRIDLKLAASPVELATIPASAEPETVPTEPTDPALRTILYVEDNPANIRLVEEVIGSRSDLRLLTAFDGHLGIEMARNHLPDLILMDINLPGISGNDAARILRADATTSHIPIVGLSANAMPRDIAVSKKIGFLRYLTKPIDIAELLATIDEALAPPTETASPT